MPDITLEDGTEIEISIGCATHGPGDCAGKGQHVASSSTWYRVKDGEWHRCAYELRSMHKVRHVAKECKTLSDFVGRML